MASPAWEMAEVGDVSLRTGLGWMAERHSLCTPLAPNWEKPCSLIQHGFLLPLAQSGCLEKGHFPSNAQMFLLAWHPDSIGTKPGFVPRRLQRLVFLGKGMLYKMEAAIC